MNDSILSFFLKVAEKEFTGVTVGVGITLIFFFRVFDIPAKWDKLNNNIKIIAKRQRRIYQVLKILAYDREDNEKIMDFLELSKDSEEDSGIF